MAYSMLSPSGFGGVVQDDGEKEGKSMHDAHVGHSQGVHIPARSVARGEIGENHTLCVRMHAAPFV